MEFLVDGEQVKKRNYRSFQPMALGQ